MTKQIEYAMDTETINREGGGQAVLIALTGPLGTRTLEFPRSLDDTWRFLTDGMGPREVREIWSYNMDFDVGSLLHHDIGLDIEGLHNLCVTERCGTLDGSDLFWRSGRIFEWKRGRIVLRIYDLASFFQMPLRAAACKYLSEDMQKQEIPPEWYSRIDELLASGGKEAERIHLYCRRDAECALALGQMLEDAFAGVGVALTRPTSPAAVAGRHFGSAIRERAPIPRSYDEEFRRSYHGGRIEIGVLGRIGPSVLYDIRSAYPWAYATLKSLKNAIWCEGKSHHIHADYGVYHARLTIPEDVHWGPVPLQTREGRLIYPVGEFDAWIGQECISDLLVRGWVRDIHYSLEAHCTDSRFVFDGVHSLFEARKDPEKGIALKLLLNSLYGKLAEDNTKHELSETGIAYGAVRRRSKSMRGPLTRYVLASAITERVRMRLWRAAMEAGDRCYAMLTDALILSADAPPLVCGEELGDWSVKDRVIEGWIAGNGRYLCANEDGTYTVKLRGVRGDHMKLWDRILNCKSSTVRLSRTKYMGIRPWIARGCDDSLGVLDFADAITLELGDRGRFYPHPPRVWHDLRSHRYDSVPFIAGVRHRI